MKRSHPHPFSATQTAIAALLSIATLSLAKTAHALIQLDDALSRARAECVSVAEAEGFMVENVSLNEPEQIVSDRPDVNQKSLTRVNAVLDLTRDGVAYRLTCPLTLALVVGEAGTTQTETAIAANSGSPMDSTSPNTTALDATAGTTFTDTSTTATVVRPDRIPIFDAGSGLAWWWLLIPLIALPILFWLLLRNRRLKGLNMQENRAQEDNLQPLSSLPQTEVGETAPLAPALQSVSPTAASAPASEPPQPSGAFAEEIVVPVIAEEMTIQTQQVARGKVRVNKRVETTERVVETPVVHEKIVVENIPINQYVTEPIPTVRDEANLLVIPLIEEVYVTEKRLFFREEVRVSKQRSTETTSQTLTLYREVVEIERIPLDGLDSPEIQTSQHQSSSHQLTNPTTRSSVSAPLDPESPQAALGEIGDRLNSHSSDDSQQLSESSRGASEPVELSPLTDDSLTEEVIIPVVAEEVTINTQEIARNKVRVHKRVETREEVVDTPIVHERVVVENIPINQYISEPIPTVRQEEGVLIIPIIEEVTVTEKRFLLREEIRVSKQRTTENISQTITLRREVVDVEQEDLNQSEVF